MNQTHTPLKVLILEDQPNDAELVVYELRKAGFELQWRLAKNRASYLEHLSEDLDVVLAGYSLPQFTATEALEILHERGWDIPFIVVTGSISEDVAVACMKQGAADYILKDNLLRLGEALRRTLADKKVRAEKRTAERKLRESEARYKNLFENNHAVMLIIDPITSAIVDANPAAARYYGWSKDELRRMKISEINMLTQDEVFAEMDRARTEQRNQFFFKHRRADGLIRDVEVYSGPIQIEGQELLYSIVHDITDRIQAEDHLRLQSAALDAAANAIVITDVEGTIVSVNQAFTALTGFEPAESIGRNPRDLVRSGVQDKAFFQNLWNTILAGHVWNGEIVNRRKDGTLYTEEQSITPVHNRDGRIANFIAIKQDITERRQAEETLRSSEERFRRAIADAPFPMLMHAETGEIVLVNQTWTDITGYTHAEIPTIDAWTERAYGERKAIVQEEIDRLYRMQERQAEGEYVITTRSGEKRIWDFSSSPVGQLSNGRRLVLSMAVDITERKQAQEALQASEIKYRQIVETAHEGICVLDIEHHVTFANNRMARMLGYSVGEMLGKSFFNFVVSDEDKKLAKSQISRRQQGFPGQYELTLKRQDGSPLIVFVSASAVMDEKNRYRGSQAMITDITELKQTQLAQQEQQVLSEALADVAMVLNTTLDLAEVLNRILGQLVRVLPYDAAYVMLVEDGMARVAQCWGFERFGMEEEMSRLQVAVGDLPDFRAMGATRQPFVISNIPEYGNWVDISATRWAKSFIAAPILRGDEVLGFLGLLNASVDFFDEFHAPRLQAFADQASTALHNAQLYEEIQRYAGELEQRVLERTVQLQREKERIEAILRSTDDVIILCQPDGKVMQTNPAFYEVFASCVEEILSQSLITLADSDDVPILEEALEAVVASGRSQRVEITVVCQFRADIVISPIFEHAKQVSGIICTLRDISVHHRMQNHLRQMLSREVELSEMKSRYVSMAAHDLRNPLAVIQNSVEIIRHYGNRLSEDKIAEKHERISKNIAVMVEMLDDILTLGKTESGRLSCDPVSVDVVDFCQGLMAEMGTIAGGGSRINFAYECESCKALIDVKLMRHVLSNLLSNALKYSPEESQVFFALSFSSDELIFEIKDQGIGIPEEDQKRLFEAFHRASNARKVPGTGLGLAIVKQSVDLHGGTIAFESIEGHGTKFTVAIPMIPKNEAKA